MKNLLVLFLLTLPAFGQGVVITGNGVTISGNGVTIGSSSAPAPTCQNVTITPYAGGTSGQSYLQLLATSGCAFPLSWTVSVGSMPPGLSVVSVGGNYQISGTISGPSQTYNFTLRVTDSNGQIFDQPTSIAVGAVCTITTPAYPGVISGQNFSQPATTTGCSAPTVWSAAVLPPGLSINPSTGTISGTVTGAGGLYNFTVQLIANGQTATQNQSITVTPACQIATLPLPNGQKSVAYSQAMTTANCQPPLQWTVGTTPPAGKIDLLDWVMMPPRGTVTRYNSALTAPGLRKYYRLDGNVFYWMKNSPQTAADINVYDANNLKLWITEDGDAADQAACVAAGFANCFLDPSASKRYVIPPSLAPRFFTLGGPDVTINNPGSNFVIRTTNCGADAQPQINIQNIVGVLHDAGSMTIGPDGNSNSITAPTLILNYYYGLSSTSLPYQSGSRERFYLQLGYGQTQWDHATWTGSSYTVDQTSTTATILTSAPPTPNFACGLPAVPGGSLPPGTPAVTSPQLDLVDSTGTISGTPTIAGIYPFTLQLEDSSPTPQIVTQNQSINITAAAGTITSNLNCGAATSQTDGPSALPIAWNCSAESDTPMTTATVVPVHAGGNLATAYAGAACGSDIQIDAGVTLSMGTTTLAAKGCDDSHWIWIRTVPSGQQAAQGTVTCPQLSNVSSGTDYGIYPCAAGFTAQATTAKLSMSGPIQITGDHIRFENLEVVNDGTNTSGMSLFVLAGGNKIVIDRNWIHGAHGVQTNNAIDVTSSSNVAIVENYISDSHCLNGPAQQCSEGHGIFGGSGVTTLKIDHNFISAGGQQIFFGGGGPGTGAPQDVEIYYNHGFKPCSWNPSGCRGVPYNGGVGGHFYVVKNQVEFKYINRVVLQGNIWENVWGGSTQVGNAITISPKNQTNSIGGPNLCPTCFTTNITERYDKILYAGQGLQIFNDVNANGQLAAEGNSYSIHDDMYIHLGYAGCFQCNAYFNELYSSTNASATQVMHDVTINHITQTLDTFAGSDQLEVGGPSTGTLQSNLIWENSIMPAGQFGIGNVGGQTNQCAFSPAASTPKYLACSTGSVYANAVPYASGTSCGNAQNGFHGCGGTWSGAGTISLADQNAVGYTNFAADNFLITSGPLFNTALDGKTYGADIVTLNQQIANAP